MKKASTGSTGGRPMIMARRGVVSSGHYLATEAGLSILRRGGNAADAAAAAGFALTVLKPHQNGIGGEVPTLVYSAAESKVHAVSGHGIAPAEATPERFAEMGVAKVPGDGFLPATVPPAPATWMLLLERFGSMRLAEVLAPAVELAADGFGMYDALARAIAGSAEKFAEQWPTSAETFCPGGEPPAVGELWRNPDWAKTFGLLIAADEGQADRLAGLKAAADVFYRGEIARRIVEFCRATEVLDASGRAHAGLLAEADLAGFAAHVEEPVTTNYRGVDVFKCGPWTQGPVLLQHLNLLEQFDVAALGHNSAEYIHTVVECMKLSYADREFYYGDPKFVDVPLGRLLSKAYAAERAKLVDAAAASMQLRPGGREPIDAADVLDVNAAVAAEANPPGGDTTTLAVIDAEGNMVSATPRGGWLMASPVIPGMGFPLGTRGQMFSLVAGHPNCLEPGKRPRSTLTPSIATRDGRPYMSFGSPGGDCQDQWALQAFLNVVEFGMCLQEAVEAPTVWSSHFPNSFYPRTARPGVLNVDSRIGSDIRDALAALGHKIESPGPWSGGNTCAAAIDPATGLRHAAASPHLDPAYAAGY